MNDMSHDFEQIEIDISRTFSEYVFKDAEDLTDDLNGMESEIYKSVTNALETVTTLSAFVPVLPKQLMAFLDEVGKENTDFDKICNIVESDISLAGETVRVANSPLYRRTSVPVESIAKAIAMLGLDGVNVIATSLMMKQALEIKSENLQKVGDLLWTHCLECAEACRLLNDGGDDFHSYLLGLVHDVGAIAIFSCFANRLQEFDSSQINHNKVLTVLLEEQGSWISAHVAKEWKLPEPVIRALNDFDKIRQVEILECDKSGKSQLSLILEQANHCSEVYTLVRDKILDEEKGQSLLIGLGLSKDQLERVFSRFEVMQDS